MLLDGAYMDLIFQDACSCAFVLLSLPPSPSLPQSARQLWQGQPDQLMECVLMKYRPAFP